MKKKSLGKILEHYFKHTALVATATGIIGPVTTWKLRWPLILGSVIVTMILLLGAAYFRDSENGVEED